MTAHIDEEQLENAELDCGDCDPHDCHALRRYARKLKHSRSAYIFFLILSVFFNILASIEIASLREVCGL